MWFPKASWSPSNHRWRSLISFTWGFRRCSLLSWPFILFTCMTLGLFVPLKNTVRGQIVNSAPVSIFSTFRGGKCPPGRNLQATNTIKIIFWDLWSYDGPLSRVQKSWRLQRESRFRSDRATSKVWKACGQWRERQIKFLGSLHRWRRHRPGRTSIKVWCWRKSSYFISFSRIRDVH